MTTTSPAVLAADPSAELSRKRLAIGFMNWAHAIDH